MYRNRMKAFIPEGAIILGHNANQEIVAKDRSP
jgi:hypothetical protein